MINILRLLIILMLVPVLLGVFGEELLGGASDTLIPIFFLIAMASSATICSIYFRSKSKKLIWFSLFIFFINLILLFLFYNFHPGF